MEDNVFREQLQELIKAKMLWFNTERLQELISQYRLLQTCVGNMFDMFSKKSIIVPDPYRLDKRISNITVPESSSFTEAETAKVFGTRFSDYNTMLDYICTYFRFSVENITIPQIKKLVELNNYFEWGNLSSNNPKCNTRALAMCISAARSGAPSVVQSMLNDSTTKSAQAAKEINNILNELGQFQREVYKAEVRKDICEHPDFDSGKAYSSPEQELAEFKRLYTRVMGKRVFYNDLISEIIEEDQSQNKEKRRNDLLAKLQITKKQTKIETVIKNSDSKELLMTVILTIAAFAPTLSQLHSKLSDNFTVFFTKKNSFINKLIALLKNTFHIKEKDRICYVTVVNPKTGEEKSQKVNATDFLLDIAKKINIYTGIGNRGPEYSKIESSSEDAILTFVNKQISEVQSFFTTINALDSFFKKEVDLLNRSKIKGMQIELSALRNSLINANKKRGEYASTKEEEEQMKKLGIKEND